MFNFTALGETLLVPNILEYVRQLLEEGHFVEVVTNASLTLHMREISEFPSQLLSRLMLKCSFHYAQLKARNLLKIFSENVNKIRQAGASISIELMPSDDLIPEINAIYDFSVANFGAPCHLTVGRDSRSKRLPILTSLSLEEYQNTWSSFDSELFRFKLSVFTRKQCDFCYAGKWMSLLQFDSGDLSQCYRGLRSLNIYSGTSLSFKAIGSHCREPHCYNAHVWLTFGCIPSLVTPYYDEVRNRKCSDGSEWLQPEFKAFCHQKFAESNPEYTELERRRIDLEMSARSAVVNCIDAASKVKQILFPHSRSAP